jgi:hypothetical protein
MWARPMWSAALALGVVLLAAACSGGESGSKDAASSTAATSTAVVKPVRSKPECLKLAQALGEASTLVSEGMAGTIFAWDPLGDASGFRGQDVIHDAHKFALVAAGAPDEVKDSFGTFNETLQRLTTAVRGVTLDGFTPPTEKVRARLQAFQSKTDTRKLAKAQGRLTNWFNTRCPYY